MMSRKCVNALALSCIFALLISICLAGPVHEREDDDYEELDDSPPMFVAKKPTTKAPSHHHHLHVHKKADKSTDAKRGMKTASPEALANEEVLKVAKEAAGLSINLQDLKETVKPKGTPTNKPDGSNSSSKSTPKPTLSSTHKPDGTTTHKPGDTTTHKPAENTTHKPSGNKTYRPSDITTHKPDHKSSSTKSPNSTTTAHPDKSTSKKPVEANSKPNGVKNETSKSTTGKPAGDISVMSKEDDEASDSDEDYTEDGENKENP